MDEPTVDETKLPADAYSRTLRRVSDNPAAIAVKGTTVELVTLLGHAETWVIKTVRINGADTAFLQRINADGGQRFVLPPEVTSAMARQNAALSDMARRQGARRAAATREAAGIKPGFLKNPHRGGKRKARRRKKGWA